MPTFKTRIFDDGETDAVLLPDEISFGPDVDVVLTRAGDAITMCIRSPYDQPGACDSFES